MATVQARTTTWTTAVGDKAAGTFTPAAGELIVVWVGTSGIAGGTTNVVDDQGGTYTEIFATDPAEATNTKRMNVWVRNALVASAVGHIVTATQASSSGGGLSTFTVAGMTQTGATAVLTSGSQSSQTAGTTPAPVLSATPQAGNPIISAIINASNPGGVTQRTGYSLSANNGYNTPTTGQTVIKLDSGETSATITWGGTSATAFGSLAIELDASGAAAAEDPFPVFGGGYYPTEG